MAAVMTLTDSAAGVAAPAGMPDLLQAAEWIEPHRAAYDLSLDRGLSEPGVAAAVGRLEFEWTDVCSGWAVHQRSRVLLDRSDGPRVDFGWTLDSWEAKDGLSYRFIVRRFLNGRETEETRGEAQLEAAEDAGRARFEKPDPFEVKLPPGTVFPTAHSLEILARAEARSLPFWRTLFDGSGDEEGLSGVSVMPVRSLAVEHANEKADDLGEGGAMLRGQPAWRVQLAFFSPGSVDAAPLHEQSITLYRNGVADDLLFDYGDFSLRAQLVELESLPDETC